MEFWIVGTTSALAIGVAHWLPWRMMLGHDLPRLAAYTIGTAIIMVPPTIAALNVSAIAAGAVALFWTSAVAAGAATCAAWAIDWLLNSYHAKQDENDAEIYADDADVE